jgi:hypothetical protein
MNNYITGAVTLDTPNPYWTYNPSNGGGAQRVFGQFRAWASGIAPKALSLEKEIDNALKPFNIEPMKQNLHLVTAILARIAHFHALKLNFSGHDITKSLREKVAAGEYALRDVTETDTFDNQVLPVIDHSKVRDVVKELFELDLVPNYKPKNHYDSATGRSYVLYEYDKPPAPVTAPASAAQNFVALQNVAVANQTPITTATQKAPLKQPDAAMWKKFEDYLDAQFNAGKRPTMKSAQSRLKGYKITCVELQNKANQNWQLKFSDVPSKTRLA